MNGGGGGGASLGRRTRFPRRAGGRCATNANAPCALEEAHAGEERRRGRRRGVVDNPGPVEVDDASLGDHGLRDARRRSPHEVDAARGTTIHGFFQLALARARLMMVRACRDGCDAYLRAGCA